MLLSNVRLLFGDASQARDNIARYELREAIGELSEIVLEVRLTDPELDMAQVVGKAACVQFLDQPVLTQVDGIVRRCRQLSSEPTGVSRYEVFVVSPLWLTTLRTEHRIFQDLSVPEVVEAVLRGYGGRVPLPVKALVKDHPKREYCVQYAETDHDFICRLLAEEGICHYFEPDESGASPGTRWVLADDITVGQPKISVPFVGASGQTPGLPHVLAVEVTADVTTSIVTARDYDYQKPGFVLQSMATTADPLFDDEGGLEAYVFEVGKFATQKSGDLRAGQLLEEARTERRVLRLATSFAMPAGAHLAVSGLPGHAMESEVVVVRARSSGMITPGAQQDARISYALECVPAGHPVRPRRRPKQRIWGTQTAFVVGEKGSEIDVDELGRVKVAFRWDRRDPVDGRPTRRVRVSQGWAGGGFGFVVLPRVSDEVIVAYLDGDPDEPIIVGRVHNAVSTTPLKLPEEKTQSIWKSRSSPGGNGFNEILMEDRAGQERLDLRAQRDHDLTVLHDSVTTVGHDETVSVKGAQSTSAGSISASSGSTVEVYAETVAQITGASAVVVYGPLAVVKGKNMVAIYSPNKISVHGKTVGVAGDDSVEIESPTVTITGGKVIVSGDASVEIKGGTVNIGEGAAVNITAGAINLTGAINLNG
jgi:type VI secretion system secreted protein VgrG